MPAVRNPYEAIPPDFLADRYTAARQPFIDDFHLTNEEAALRLTNIWIDQNAIDRDEWDAQIQAEELLAQQREEQQQAQADEQRRRREEEEEQAHQDEWKKHRNKFLPFADVPMSAIPPVLPSPLALRKLRKGEFCELYFFTNKGLADAQATAYSTDDEALTLVQDDKGLHSFIPLVAAKAKKDIIEDKDLTWTQIDEATHRIVKAMKECGWEDSRVRAHIEFWIALASHPWRHHADERRRRALVHYQAISCKRWHDSLGMEHSFNLKYIQPDVLDEIKSEIVDNAAAVAANKAKEASLFHSSAT